MTLNGSAGKSIAILLALASASALLFYMFLGGGSITGMASAGLMEYVDDIGVAVKGDALVNVTLSSEASNLRLSGRAEGGNDVSVRLVGGGFDALMLEPGSFVKLPPSVDTNTKELVALVNTSLEAASNVTTRLAYYNGSRWDQDDDGVEEVSSAIDYSVQDTAFDFPLKEDKACTLWQVYSVYSGNLTTVCYGGDACCRLYGMAPVPDTLWNDTFYLHFGRYSALERNLVGARVSYADIGGGQESTYAVYRGQWEYLGGFFYVPEYSFDAVCIDLCGLTNIPSNLVLEVKTGAETTLRLDKALYEAFGQRINYGETGVGNFTVSVTDREGRPIGHYAVRYVNGTVDLTVTSAPRRGRAASAITGALGPAGYLAGPEEASEAPSYVHIAGLEYSHDNLSLVFDGMEDARVVSRVLALAGGPVFREMTVTLPAWGEPSLVSACADYVRENFTCLGWEPYTTDFRFDGGNVTFKASRGGVYAATVSSAAGALMEYSGAPVQGPAYLNAPVEWTQPLRTLYSNETLLDVELAVPPHAGNLSLSDAASGDGIRLREAPGGESASVVAGLWGGREYVLSYVTPPPMAEELGPLDTGYWWSKIVHVYSDVEYGGVGVYSSLSNVSRNRIVVLDITDGGGYDISNDPLYNLSLEDVENDGIADWAHWRLPKQGNRTFRVLADRRPTLLGSTGEYIRSYVNPDGTYSSEISLEPLNYLLDGVWTEYDTHLIAGKVDEYGYSTGGVDHGTYFSSSSAGGVRFGVGEGYVLSRPVGASDSRALASGDTLAYYGAWNDTDLVYTVEPKRLKEEIVLRSVGSPPEYVFMLTPEGAVLREDEYGYGVYDENDTRVFGFTAPYAYDARGRRGGVEDELVKTGRDYTYTLTVDAAFLESAEYPVVIDPTWSVGGRHVTVDGDTDGVRLFTEPLTLAVGNASARAYRSFLEFNVSGIDDSATVTSVKLGFYVANPMGAGCTHCSCLARPLAKAPSEYVAAGDAPGLWAAIGASQPYGVNGSCGERGFKEMAFNEAGRGALEAWLPSDVFPVGLSSQDEAGLDDYAALASSEAQLSRQPTLTVEWATSEAPVSPDLWLDGIVAVQSSPRCRYDAAARAYACEGDSITVNGTVMLLADGEDSARSISFVSQGPFAVTPEGGIDAAGRDLFEPQAAGATPDGGDITVDAARVSVEGPLVTKGGGWLSSSGAGSAGDAGDVTLTAADALVASAAILADGGGVDPAQEGGFSGGSGGQVTITSRAGSVNVADVSADAGYSLNGQGKSAGGITLEAADSVSAGSLSAAGADSPYVAGGGGGSITAKAANDVTVACVNVSGGSSDTGAGGAGGQVLLESSAGSISSTCGLQAYSGYSDSSLNREGGSVAVKAQKGSAILDKGSIQAYGGPERSSGRGGGGGMVSVEAQNILLGFQVNASGGDASGDAGFGGGGGSVTLEYCVSLGNGTAAYDVSGGDGAGASGADGSMSAVYLPLWCGVTPPAEAPEVLAVSPADGAVTYADHAVLKAVASDPQGGSLNVSFIGGNDTGYGTLYTAYDVPAGGRVHAVAKPEVMGYIVEFHEPSVMAERARLMKEIKDKRQGPAASGDALALESRLPAALNAQRAKVAAEHELALQALGDRLPVLKDKSRLRGEYAGVFNGIAVDVTEAEAGELARLPEVKSVRPDYRVRTALDNTTRLIGAPAVWAMTDGAARSILGEGVSIAVLDTGVDYTHPDLGGCLGSGCKVAGGWDFVNGDADPMDDNGHGTKTASIAAGDGVLDGVAPKASILAYKVLGADGSGSASAVLSALERALDPNGDGDYSDGADVILLSLGIDCIAYDDTCGPDDFLSRAVDDASGNGAVVVVAAGNGGPSEGSIASPATARGAVTVASSDKADGMASSSGRGPVVWYGGALAKPDITAPGVDVCSAKLSGLAEDDLCVDGEHSLASGTSMAAPQVAGAAALILQKWPGLSPEDVKSILRYGAKDIGFPFDVQGHGRLDLPGVLAGDNPPPTSDVVVWNNTPVNGALTVSATASSQEFQRYELYRADGLGSDGAFTLVASDETPAADAPIYGWDVSALPAGSGHTFKLSVYDSQGRRADSYAYMKLALYGAEIAYDWRGLAPGTYRWRAEAYDGAHTAQTPWQTFTVSAGEVTAFGGTPMRPPDVALVSPAHMSRNETAWRMLTAVANDINNDSIHSWIYAGNSSSAATGLMHYALSATNSTTITYNMTALPVSPGEDSLVLLLHLDNYSKEGENNTWVKDYSGKGNDGTVYGDAHSTSSGKLAGAFSLDGSGDYLGSGDINAVDGKTRLAVSAWVKSRVSGGASSEAHIVDKSLCTGQVDGGVFELLAGSLASSKAEFIVFKNGGSPNYITSGASTTSIDDTGWHLVTGVYDGAELSIYIDGVKENSNPTAGITFPSTSHAVQVGGDCSGTHFYWDGIIDEVAVWNRSLSASEVLDMYRLRNGSYWWWVNTSDGVRSNYTSSWMFTVGEVSGNSGPVFGYRNWQPVESNGTDSYLSSGSPTVNYGGEGRLQTGRSAGSSYRSLLWFNVSQIPPNANVTASWLRLFLYNSTYSLPETPYNLTAAWAEGYVTWNKRDQANDWGAPGGDYV